MPVTTNWAISLSEVIAINATPQACGCEIFLAIAADLLIRCSASSLTKRYNHDYFSSHPMSALNIYRFLADYRRAFSGGK
jgi:hypothetical protein